jgi:hypothetical protein
MLTEVSNRGSFVDIPKNLEKSGIPRREKMIDIIYQIILN